MAERESHVPFGVAPEDAQTIDELANHCFGCSPDNPQGLKLMFVTGNDDAGMVTATCHLTLTRMHEGPPGHIHGGIIATLLDEAMSKLNRPLNILAMTRSLSVDYLKPSPLYVPLLLVGRHVKRDGRKVLHTADLMLEDGTVLAHAEGFFLVIPPEMMAAAQQRKF
jgi:acyl-coenzyme A thioesterase PaaI-like protein